MATVTRLSHYRSVTRRDLPLSIGVGDSDLVPVALVLWCATIVRVVLAVLHDEVFGAEASFALLCAVLLPWFMVRARNRGVRSR